MSSAWMTFQNAGLYSFGILLCAMLAFALGLVALIGSLASGKSRAWVWLGSATFLVTAVGFFLGGGGTWLLRRKVDDALAGADVEWSSLERIYVEGFSEARDASVVALVCMSLPFVLAGAATAIAALRVRVASGERPKADLVVAGLACGFALLAAVSALAGVRSGEQAAKDRAVNVMRAAITAELAQSDCKTCESLSGALAWRGAAQLEQDVPGTRDQARKCVESWLLDLDAGKSRSGSSCRGSDAPWAAPTAAPTATRPADSDGTPEGDARARALADAAEFGMIGLLGSSPPPAERRSRELEALRDSPLLVDEDQRKRVSERIAQEAAKANPPSDADGALGLNGNGFGDSTEKTPGNSKSPRVRLGAASVAGRLPPEVIQRIVRQNFGRFRLCYENGLRNNPKLEGRVSVRFVIGRDGSVSNVGSAGSDLPDSSVVACVTRAFNGLSFPQPEGGIVTVSYPLIFTPGG